MPILTYNTAIGYVGLFASEQKNGMGDGVGDTSETVTTTKAKKETYAPKSLFPETFIDPQPPCNSTSSKKKVSPTQTPLLQLKKDFHKFVQP